jgi:BirA family transcriptional regulator, biotin operon repressor / biotin---[acetyl-CoA-carboxylase] ligase
MKAWVTAGGNQVRWYESLSSTNDEAKHWAKEGALSGSVVGAEMQIAGRGRRGAEWVSEVKKSLTFSVIVKPNLDPVLWSRLSLVVGVAVIKTLDEYGLYAEVKWPNDVLVQGKKISGILVETAENKVIIGIGINVNDKSFTDAISGIATSIYLHLGKEIDRFELLENLVAKLFFYIELATIDYATVLDFFRERCALKGKKISLISMGKIIYGAVHGIADGGELLLEQDGSIKKFYQADCIRLSDHL